MTVQCREYSGPVLIAQGALDPLNDAPTRAGIFKGIREGVTVDLLPLGHCPMDEDPKMVSTNPPHYSALFSLFRFLTQVDTLSARADRYLHPISMSSETVLAF
jgi:hypothetical protein